MTLDSIKGAAMAGAEKAQEYAKQGAEKAAELGKEGYNTAKEYGKKGFEAIKDFGVKAGEKLKPLAQDTVAIGKKAASYVKANPGKTAAIAGAAIALAVGVGKLVSMFTHKAPEKTQAE